MLIQDLIHIQNRIIFCASAITVDDVKTTVSIETNVLHMPQGLFLKYSSYIFFRIKNDIYMHIKLLYILYIHKTNISKTSLVHTKDISLCVAQLPYLVRLKRKRKRLQNVHKYNFSDVDVTRGQLHT